MRVLFIGGTGIISSACAARCIELGHDLYLLNRGQSVRQIPEQANVLRADYRDTEQARDVLDGMNFDVVVDFIAFNVEHTRTDVELFRGRTGQYVFISSASAYQTPPESVPVTEETPLGNPFWQYSRDKAAGEKYLMGEYEKNGFPVTIVRPSHTYDRRSVPVPGAHLLFRRAQAGKKIVVHGDGTSLWTLTHNTDFAIGFCGLFGQNEAIGEDFHITSDEYLPWNKINRLLLENAGLGAELIHLPSDLIVKYDAEFGAGLLGDKAHSMIFDNSKIKKMVPEFEAKVPFTDGAKEIADWYLSNQDDVSVDEDLDKTMDRMVADYESIG
ncbi:MAG: NAD-dependent epimerase/dehydratase family protein [Candidatus Marinimicrobia bacterium]|nr:NAD-dependent epimerase/dehydratase family protein [Candidatus Neomarinimicrobiota bacterium]MCF7827634.1 NAD-dependent epimerase/dehydratase family protein [Candidatus Neomarinimicrobiota bacterium]MCF7881311.1 NAD-dependent epimerase/dehydratase family protein [Candidatus Neomarinimicrobiota bacterium]